MKIHIGRLFKWVGFIAAVCTILGFIRGCGKSNAQGSHVEGQGNVQISVVGDQNVVGNVAAGPLAFSGGGEGRGETGDSITAEDLKAGVLKYQTAGALFHRLDSIPLVEQGEYAQKEWRGKRIEGWRLAISFIYPGSNDEWFQFSCFDPEFPEQHEVYFTLGKGEKELVDQLSKGDRIVVNGRVADIATEIRVLTLEEANIAAVIPRK